MATDARVHVHLGINDGLHFSRSGRLTSPASLDDLDKLLSNPEAAFLLEAGGQVVQSIVNPSLERPLTRRLADAASWYGQAVREEFTAARIVKAVTALERLLLVGETLDIARMVSERGAALAVHPTSRFDYEGWRQRINIAYELRSRLVHGSLSPFDSEVQFRASWCVGLSEEVLRAGLGAFHAVRGLDRDIANKDLVAWFGELVERAKQGKPTI